MKGRKRSKYLLFILLLGATILPHYMVAQELTPRYLKQTRTPVISADIGGTLHGIAFDNRGHMFVAKNGKEIFRVTPEGRASLFAILEAKVTAVVGSGGSNK